MKRIIYGLLLLVFFSACSADTEIGQEPLPLPDNGMIRVNVITPKITTRATQNMPVGSTIRLYTYKYTTWDPTPGSVPNSDPIMVNESTFRIDTNGATVLCEVNDKGEWIRDITNSAMHIPADRYCFHAVSPAIKLNLNGDDKYPGIAIYHGSNLELRTTGVVERQVSYNSTEVGQGTPGIFNLYLPAFELLTSKITFKIVKTDKVGELEFVDSEDVAMMKDRGMPTRSSVVIEELTPDNYNHNNNFQVDRKRLIPFLTPSANAVLGLTANEIKQRENDTDDYEFYFESEIIPCRLMDANGNPYMDKTEDNLNDNDTNGSKLEAKETKIRLHMNVSERNSTNKNYKTFSVTLPENSFKRAYQYNYTLKVDLGGILVSGWNTSEWVTIIN